MSAIPRPAARFGALTAQRFRGLPPIDERIVVMIVAALVWLLAASLARGAMRLAGPPGDDALAAQAAVDPLQRRMLDDAADGRLDSFSLLQAAMIAAGISDRNRLEEAELRIDRLAADLPPAGRSIELATAAHRLLRTRVLTGPYRDDAADVAATLDGGPHNCLTATILLHELCRRRGLSAVAVSIPGHVFTRIPGAHPFDIQVTSDDGLLPAASAKNVADERVLSDTQLVAKVYYNRALSRYRVADFGLAVGHLQRAMRLDPQDLAARQNLSAVYNNWALAECAAGRHRAALEALAAARRLTAEGTNLPSVNQDAPNRDSLYRDSRLVENNEIYVRGRWADSLCRQQRFAEAAAVLDDGRRLYPHAEFFVRGLAAVDELARSEGETSRTD